jgi:hypothetical protein
LKRNFNYDHAGNNYVSLQAVYLHRKLTNADSGYFRTWEKMDSALWYSSAVIRCPVLAFALKTGKEFSFAHSRFYLDAFIGAGVRWVFTDYNATDIREVYLPPSRGFFKNTPEYDAPGTHARLHLTIGIRAGWKVK